MTNVEKEAIARTTADKTVEIKREFTERFECGTKAHFTFSIKIENFAVKDLREIMTFISTSARQFYLFVAEKFNSKP